MATQLSVSLADMWQLSLAAHKCTGGRFQKSIWHTSYNCNDPVWQVNDFVLPVSYTV